MSDVPPATPHVIGGQWEFVAHSASDEVVDVVHLTLVNLPPGHLEGAWRETILPGYSLGLVAECNVLGNDCSGSYGVSGSVEGGTFSIQVGDGTSFSGALGNGTPPRYHPLRLRAAL